MLQGLRIAVSRVRRLRGRPLALVVVLAGVLALVPAAGARADSAMGGSTMGTASTVSPSTIAVGGTLTYTLSGFPEGATVEILVDDGDLAPGGESGAISELTVGEDGTYSGAVELPAYVSKGPHWLRFRVTAGEDIPTNAVRTLDYTNKSPYFTVADVTIIGGESRTNLPTQQSAGDTVSSVTATATQTAAAAGPAAAAGGDTDGSATGGSNWASASLPVVTTVLFALAAVLLVLTVIVLIERRRLTAYERELEYAARR
ncbi:hypothetical protein SAMN05216355_10623 [Actinomyces ruminicola]|uniref:DNA-directed RNA polymerase II n=1 Tax=Actinomyces ruminicola TaxID=332524 RepID=A0A1H0C774_9ACTO|nr:hypothetical protein [Actinomyces ruminicola]SDN53666.1 hypothetical protein SAMN05216355_10623 [Actinomyces ruminicola]